MKKNPNSLKQKIQSLLSAPGYKPLRVSEVISALKVPPQDRKEVTRSLDRLLQEGVIVRIRKDRLILPSEADLVTGRIEMHERGFGFVSPEKAEPGSRSEDIFIPAEDTWVAMHKDRVVVRIHHGMEENRSARNRKPDRDRPNKRMGRVIRILERANPTMIGVLQRSQHFHYIVPDDPRIGRDIYVRLGDNPMKAKVGDRVVVKLHEWKNRHINPEGDLAEVIGSSDDPSLDLVVIVKKFGFRTDFPADVEQQAEAIEERVSSEERQARVDFTSDLVITIDPDDARDYDDALSLKKLSNDRFQLGVHIADVSHYVKHGTPLDLEAKERGNSVYLPDRVIPMLPQKLSNGICSLKEGVERLTFSAIFEVTPNAEIRSVKFASTIIHSAARLTYGKALSVLESQPGHEALVPNPEVRALIRSLWSLASKFRQKRFANGSLDLDFPELKVYCDERGLAQKIEKQENDISHQLVEEFMLLANEAVAAEIQNRTVPGIYRIHDVPDEERLGEYRELAISMGYTMGDPTLRGEIQKFLKSLTGKPDEYILKLNLLKSLKRAQYSTSPIGHFGLAKANYTHFTSPIRRYADLIVHRVLRRLIQPKSARSEIAYDAATLENIAHHCSTTERTADEAEKEAVKLKLIEYFERQLHEHKLDKFDALVTEVRNFGVFVELPKFMLSGLIHVSTLHDDFYQFEPTRQKLMGKRTKRVIQAGDKVQVEVDRVDRFKKQIDFRLSEESDSKVRKKRPV